MKKISIIAIAALAIACGQAPKEAEENTENQVEQTEPTNEDQMVEEEMSTGSFGDEITEDGAVTPAEFMTMIEGKDSMEVKLVATINACCQKKGCWMDVEMAEGQTMKVRFKDYGFFVPKNSAGNEVVMSGMARLETIDVETLQHYAEDGGATAEEIAAITEPEEKYTFEATGVIIR